MNSGRLVQNMARAVLVFLYVPIVVVIVYSFNSASVNYRWDGFTFNWYMELFQDEQLGRTLQNSLIIGVSSATLAVVFGLAFSLGIRRFAVKSRSVLIGLVALPLILPEIVLAAALLSLFSETHISLSFWTLILGHLVVVLPLSTLIVMGATANMDPSLPEAAQDLGCTSWQVFWRVQFPLLRSAIFASWLIAFTTSFSNIVMSTFLSGVGNTTLPLRIFSTLKTGLTPAVNALGTILIMFTLAVVLTVGVAQMRYLLMRRQVEHQ